MYLISFFLLHEENNVTSSFLIAYAHRFQMIIFILSASITWNGAVAQSEGKDNIDYHCRM